MSETEIYQRIKQRLDALGLSERAASMQASGNAELIRNIRRGKSVGPRSGNLTKLARVLGVTESWLLGTTDEMSASEPASLPGVRYAGIVEAGAGEALERMKAMQRDGKVRRH